MFERVRGRGAPHAVGQGSGQSEAKWPVEEAGGKNPSPVSATTGVIRPDVAYGAGH